MGNAAENFQKLRDNFEEIKKEASDMANKWGIKTQFKENRQRHVKKFFDELCEDERYRDPERSFKINVFYANLDIIIRQVVDRFLGVKEVVNRFNCLNPKQLSEMDDAQLVSEAQSLAMKYPCELSSHFPCQLLSTRNVLRKQISSLEDFSISGFAELIIQKHKTLLSSIPEVLTLSEITDHIHIVTR